MPSTWLSYRLFINPSDPEQVGVVDDYAALLRQVVGPLLAEYDGAVGRYHFQMYAGPYRYFPEAGGVLESLGFGANDIVQFIRLRLDAENEQGPALHSRLRALCQEAPACRGWELPSQPYDPVRELGDRFGAARADPVLEMLHGASRLALQFATDDQPYDPTANGEGGAAGAMHLMGITLRYIVPGFVFENGQYHHMPLPVVVMDWERELRYSHYPIP